MCLLKTFPKWVGASGLERIFTRVFVKNFRKLGWREYNSEIEHPLAHPFCWISPIGASNILGNRANRKRELFKGILQEMSSGHMKSILRGIQCKCFQVMSLLIGPGMSPPKCGRGVTGMVTNGDKLLCNTNDPPERVDTDALKWPARTILHGHPHDLNEGTRES